MPRRGVGAAFPDLVRARARRHRARARLAAATLVLLLGGIGVGVGAISDGPVPLAAGAGLAVERQPLTGTPASQPPQDPDAATAAAVTAAIRDAYTHNVPADRFAAAVQDGPALTDVHARVLAHFPRLGSTIEVKVDDLRLLGPDTVSAAITLTFTDPTAPVPAPMNSYSSYGTSAQAVLTPGGWRLSRDSYCGTIALLGVPDLTCPPR